MAMVCGRHKTPVGMYRVTNAPGTPNEGTALARCSKCCKTVECAYCPKCGNTLCVPCFNRGVEDQGKPPALGPALGESSNI